MRKVSYLTTSSSSGSFDNVLNSETLSSLEYISSCLSLLELGISTTGQDIQTLDVSQRQLG